MSRNRTGESFKQKPSPAEGVIIASYERLVGTLTNDTLWARDRNLSITAQLVSQEREQREAVQQQYDRVRGTIDMMMGTPHDQQSAVPDVAPASESRMPAPFTDRPVWTSQEAQTAQALTAAANLDQEAIRRQINAVFTQQAARQTVPPVVAAQNPVSQEVTTAEQEDYLTAMESAARQLVGTEPAIQEDMDLAA